jgi:hypothetical protein
MRADNDSLGAIRRCVVHRFGRIARRSAAVGLDDDGSNSEAKCIGFRVPSPPGGFARTEENTPTTEDHAGSADLPPFWPLVPGGLSYDVLIPFLPIGFTALAEARSLGFLRDDELKTIVAAEGRPAPNLMIFLNTASIFDRDRDIAEELVRLGRDDPRGAPPLWMILGRIIADRYASPDDAVETLEQLYQWCDHPAALQPFTLYGAPGVGAAETMRRFRQFLAEHSL